MKSDSPLLLKEKIVNCESRQALILWAFKVTTSKNSSPIPIIISGTLLFWCETDILA